MSTIVRVISVKGHARRKTFHAPPDILNIEWKYFDASTGPSAGLVIDQPGMYKCLGRELTPGEVAVYCSHVLCWKEFLSTSDASQMIVFEDDVFADWSFVEQISSINWSDLGIGYLKLYVKNPAHFQILRWSYPIKDRHLVRYVTLANGANAYLIDRQTAGKFCNLLSKIDRPIDLAIERPWVTNVPVIGIIPSGVLELSMPSTINGRDSQHSNPIPRPIYYMWRAKEHLQALFYRYFSKSPNIM